MTAGTDTELTRTVESLSHGIASGDFSGMNLNSGLDALGVVANPVDALVSTGVAWLMEHVQPLNDALDMFAGDPGAIQAYAQQWRRHADTVTTTAQDLHQHITNDTVGWTGQAGDAYRAQAAQQVDGVSASAAVANSVADAVEAAGQVVSAVRIIVQELIAELVTIIIERLPIWMASAGASFGLGTPLIIADLVMLIAEWV